jgi:hypothetical protein
MTTQILVSYPKNRQAEIFEWGGEGLLVFFVFNMKTVCYLGTYNLFTDWWFSGTLDYLLIFLGFLTLYLPLSFLPLRKREQSWFF